MPRGAHPPCGNGFGSATDRLRDTGQVTSPLQPLFPHLSNHLYSCFQLWHLTLIAGSPPPPTPSSVHLSLLCQRHCTESGKKGGGGPCFLLPGLPPGGASKEQGSLSPL